MYIRQTRVKSVLLSHRILRPMNRVLADSRNTMGCNLDVFCTDFEVFHATETICQTRANTQVAESDFTSLLAISLSFLAHPQGFQACLHVSETFLQS